jgi:putative heme-binding domain-containing protein
MSNRRVRLAVCALFALSFWLVHGFDAQAQRYKTQNPPPPGYQPPQPPPEPAPTKDRYQITADANANTSTPDAQSGNSQQSRSNANANSKQAQSTKKPFSNQLRYQAQRVMPQKKATTQNGQQPTRTASKPATKAPTAAAKPQAKPGPTTMERLDPEKRAAFLKLIGANWIWSPAYQKDNVPIGDCYFRKTFQINQAEFGQVHIACDNQYELYVNGRLVGRGADWRRMDVHDVQKLLVRGTNVVAIKASNTDAGPAGLVARVVVKERGGTYESFSTDASWRVSVKPSADWMLPNSRDGDWLAAKVYGPLGGVLPWGDEIVIADEGSRFVTDPEFIVDRVVTDQQAGSIIAMTFNANGDILVSREGAGLLLVRDKNKDGTFETVEQFCSELKNIQGILSLGNRVYAVGDGLEGGALYQVVDTNGDGHGDSVKALVKFRGVIGEHGPHKVHLGPDGMLYLMSGNFAQVAAAIDPHSAYANSYEGDLVLPRYEDPQGHAAGVPAPGGTVLRTDANASFVEMVAGGFRNTYDFAFTTDGEMFTADSDMEWDIGAPWYRPTRVLHVPAGGEFGWRSGWATWPEYYLDSLPATIDTGPGSPTGVVYYDHTTYPARLQHTLFVGDWATGQINAVKLERSGATYKATVTPFLKGRPLNVTALDVGPDGSLYFATGGRGTDGGVYRVRWTGNAPPQTISFGHGIQQALDQPQLSSDWSRARVAKIKLELGDRWQTELERVLTGNRSTSKDRLRALDLLTYFGPAPTAAMLTELAHDGDPAMRVRATRLMGARHDTEFNDRLAKLLSDSDPWVRRTACEAIAHRGTGAPLRVVIKLLADPDRFVAFAARRALEKMPANQWQEQVLAEEAPRPFLQGATGLLAANPSPQLARRILARCDGILRGDVNEPGQKHGDISDANFLDLLRVVQIALVRGKIGPNEAPALTQQILREYPTRDAMMNRELVKLLAYTQPPGAAHALAHQLETDIPDIEKLQVAAYAPRITTGWDRQDKLNMMRYLEKVRGIEGGHSLAGYIEFFARDFFANLTLEERKQLISAGEKYPTSTLSVLAKLPENPGSEVLAEIRALDQRIDGMTEEPINRLRVGIVAVLGRIGEPESLAYLRNIYVQNPERRAPVAMSLTQHPEGDNWPILVDSLRTVDGDAAREILGALTHVNRRPDKSEPYRNAILLGLRLQTNGGELVAQVLEKWVGQTPYKADTPLAEQLTAWQNWYATTFPNERPAELPKETQRNKWSYDELLSYLDSSEAKNGSPSRGAQVFHDAQCMSCHRFNGKGENIGPDLSTVSQRFTKKEILESIIYPNQVVSDQYASKQVIANGKTYVGIAIQNADGGMTVMQSDGHKVELAADEIEGVEATKLSAMPEGLVNRLTLEQVADLFAFLMKAPEPNVAARDQSNRR